MAEGVDKERGLDETHAEPAERVRSLQTLTAALAAAGTPEQVAHVLVDSAGRALGARNGVLVLPTRDKELAIVAGYQVPENVWRDFATFGVDSQLPTARAYRTGLAEWIPDRAAFEKAYPNLGPHEEVNRGALVCLPLVLGDRTLGATAYRFESPRQFGDAERRFLTTFVAVAAQALDRAQTFKREVDVRMKLQGLATLAGRLAAAQTPTDVAEVVIGEAALVLRADTCTLYLQDRRGVFILIGHRGVAPEILARVRTLRAEQDLAVQSAQAGTALWAENEAAYLALFPALATLPASGPRAKAFWSMPLQVEGATIGLLGMGFYEARTFTTEERSFIETLSGYCAQALSRADRFESEQRSRRAAEQARASLETTLRSIGDAVIATDAQSAVVFLNPVAERLTGWSESEARGRPLTEVFHIVDRPTGVAIADPAQTVLQSGAAAALAGDTLLLARDGSAEWSIDDSTAPIYDETGAPQGAVVVFRDVSQKRAEVSKQTFLADATAALSASLDYQSTLSRLATLAVPRLADWCAVEIAKPDGSSEQLAVAHVDPAKVQLAWELRRRFPPARDGASGVPHVLRTGQTEVYSHITDAMLQNGVKDQEHLAILRQLNLRSVILVPISNRSRVLGAITLVAAESNRRFGEFDVMIAEELARRAGLAMDNAELYQQATQAIRYRDDFLSVASHELKTPLTSLRLQTDGIMRLIDKTPTGLPPRDVVISRLRKIERNTERLLDLIDQLLDVSRMSSGTLSLRPARVDLGPLVADVVGRFQDQAEREGVRLSLVTPQAQISASGLWDAERLDQVVTNLVSNALKYGGGLPVDVSLAQIGDHVRLEVRDHGVGISPDDQRRIFQRFERAGDTTRYPGLGLGLWISKQIIDAHGGALTVVSSPGQGSTFRVDLPQRAR